MTTSLSLIILYPLGEKSFPKNSHFSRSRSGMHPAVGSSCKAEAVMLAALALSKSEWYLLIDDDSVVRLPLAAALVSRFDPEERHALGAYPCLSFRRAQALRRPCDDVRKCFSSAFCLPAAPDATAARVSSVVALFPLAAAPRPAGSTSSKPRNSPGCSHTSP